ncbi:hypothetical protein LGL91_10325 [Yersinia ruckeri]|nr:hypothetical protein LGL91_10325 [Yersinia ruckeri]
MIRDAGGAGGFGQLWTTGRDMQPLSAIAKVSTQALNFSFCISKLLSHFGIQFGGLYSLALDVLKVGFLFIGYCGYFCHITVK